MMDTTTRLLPSTLRNGIARGGLELTVFFRNKTAVLMVFSFPGLLLVLLASIFTKRSPTMGPLASQGVAASMLAFGVVSTAFITIGVAIASDREDGTLKRLRGTPVTAVAYFIGHLILVAVVTLAELVVMLALGVLVFDMELPTDPAKWFTLAWLLILSGIACTLLGVAASTMATSAKNAPAVLYPPVITLQFLSGIFVTPINSLPSWMTHIGALFPVKWMGQGFRSVFLPDAMKMQEVAGEWEHLTTAAVLGGWCLIGLALSVATFRWSDQRAG